MPLPTEEQLGQQTTNQRLTNIAGQSSFQDWIKLKDRNAIPNNAPSLVWLDVKPGKRVFSQPFTIDDDGVQARYTNSYWNDPKRVARMHEVIDSAPEGWQAPEWLDVEGVENLYRYFEYRNTGSTWEDWKELPGDDPGIDLANYLDQPPQDVLHYDDMDPQYRAYRKIQDWYDRYNKAQTDYQAALEQQNIAAAKLIEQQYSQDTIARWDDLEPWQQFLLSRDSMTQMEGRPDWSRGIASAWTAAKTGLSVMGLTSLLFGGIGTLAAPGPGTLAGAIVGGLAGIYTGYKAYMGEENELANLLNVFNLPAEAVERIVGMIAIQQEASAQGQALPSASELANRWQASKSAYEAQVLPIGNWEANAISQIARSINPDWSSGQTADQSAGEVWMFEQGYVVPQVVEGGTMAGEALLEATARINSGEDATLIYEDMVNKYGYSGTRADFIAQNFLDPTQVVPYIINRAGGNIAGAVGDQLLRQKFLEHRGSIFVDMLPMGWQQLATAVGKDWGWRSTGGIFDVLQDYGSSLRMGAMAPDGSFTLPENFSKFQIMVGQLAYNKDGILEPRVTIPDSELKTPTNRILKVLDWAGRNTPETKAIMAQANLTTLIEHMLEIEPDNPVRLGEILEAVANRDQAKFAEITGGYVGSPQLESVVGAVRQFLDSDSYTTSIKIWEATTGKRQSLQELSIAATHDPLLPVTAAKVIELVQTGRTEELLDLIKTNPRTDNGLINNYKNRVNPETEFTNPSNFLSADAIQKRLKTFTDGTTAWHPGEFSARMLNKFVDSSTDHFVKRYDLQATNSVIRLSSLLKSAQSLYLLGLSPNFMMNNLIDGIVTTSYYGVWGVKPMSQLAKFWEEYELAIPARMNDAYGPGDITHSIFTQLNPKDLLSEAQGIVSKVNKNIGVFTTLSNKIEKMQGANAITIGTMQYLKNNWVEGVGFGKMPPDLEAKLRAKGIETDAIYALARSSKTPADFEKKFYGAYREGELRGAVNAGVKKPTSSAGPEPSVDESLAKLDNAIKDSAEELYSLNGQPLTAELLAKTGLEDTIIENISSGMDVDSAINSAIFTVKESLEQQRWTDQLSRVESDDATLTAEGFKANLQIFGDVNAENWQKSAYLRFMVEQEFEEVHRLHRAGLHSEAEAYKIEVVDELQRQKKVQAEENNVRIATLLEHMDPDNPNHLKIAENLMAIANNWDDYYNKKITAYQTFDETVRTMPWDEKRYAALRKVLSDELNTLADEAYAFESSMHKALDEYYVDILGKTDEQHEVARAWLVNAADIKRQINDATGLAFKAMAENPAQRQNIYASFTRNEFMPLAAKLHDVYDVGAVKLDNADNSYINSEIDKLVEAAGIQPKPKVRKPKTETPAAEKPEVKIKDSVIDVDDTDTKIARTIYIDQGLAIKRDTETRLKVRQLEDAYMESVKKAFPEFAKNKGKQKLAITWMRMRAETWAIDNDSSPLDFWRVYADIDNTKNTNDALSNWIKATNKQAGYTKIPAATDMQEANGFMKAVIRATDASNFESFIHEMIHPLLYLTDDATLDVLAKYGGLEDADEYKTLRVLRDTDNLSKDLLNKLYNAEEKIVNDAVKSMAQEDFGIGLSGLLKGAFVKIRSVLVNLWKKLKGQNHEVKFSDEVNNAMSKFVLGSEEARRIYDTALKSYVDEQINKSAGDAGSIDVMLGDGRYYSTHYAFIPLKDIKLPLVPAKLLSDTKQIQDRIERFRKEFPDLFAPERITDESRRAAAFKTEAEDRTIASYDKLKSQVGYEYNLEQSRLDLSSNIHQLETKLQGITTKKRYKGQAADIRKLEGEIETLRAELSNIPQTKGQLEAKLNELVANKASQTEIAKLETELALRTPLSNNEYTLLQNLYEMKKKDAPLADSGDKAAKVRVKRTEESISRLVERLQRHGSPADRANLADLESKVMKIQQERAWLQDQKQQSVSAYEDAMSRLTTNYQEINSIRAGKNKVGLQDLEKQLPQDATLPTSRIPIIQRDGTLLYDATGIIAELQAAIMGKYKQPEAVNYTLDPERGDWVGQESTGDNELYLYANSALVYRFDERSKDRLQWESDNSYKLAEYRQFVDDYHTTYGLKLTQEQIDGEPGIIALIPDVDVRKFNDPIDLKRMLSYIESDKSPKVLGKFAGELAKYLGETENMFAKAYIADITEAMVYLKYWDPLAKRGEGAWISIADPRARKVEIEAAILSERQTPVYGFRKGVLNLLEYALVRSFSKAETEQLVFGFIRKPVEAFFESDRAAAGKNVKAGEPSQYELTETRMAKLDKKIEDMVAYTDPFAKPTAKYPNVNDVVRGPYADMDTEVQSAVHIQMKQYQANLQDFLKRLEDRKNIPGAQTPSGKPTPEFLLSLEDSFVYKIPKLRAMYKAKQIILPDITKALDDIIVGKYDPDNGLHQTLLRAALKDKLEEPAVYRWLGAWNYDVHDNRIRRLQDNLDYWVLRIKNAIALDSDTSRISTRATTDINNQYRKVAEALQRTKDSGFYALSKAEMKSVTTRMKQIKETINTFAALRKKHDMTFRTRDNMVRKYELDTRSADAIIEDNIALRDAEGRPFDLPPEDVEKVAPTQEDVQLTKQLNQFTKQHVEDSDLEFAQYFLANYGLTTEMLEQITPQDTIKLLGKTYNADAYVEVSRGTEDVGNKYMLDEYEKMLKKQQPPAPPAESGYATQVMTYDSPPYDLEKKHRRYPYPYGRKVSDYSIYDDFINKLIAPDTTGLYDFTKMQSEAKAIFIAKDIYRFLKRKIEIINSSKRITSYNSYELKLILGKLNEVGELANKNNYTEAYKLIQQIDSIFRDKLKFYTSLDHEDKTIQESIKIDKLVYLDDLDNVIRPVITAKQADVSTPGQTGSQQPAPAPKQPMNNPTGSTPMPMMTGYAGAEVFDMDLYPLLSSIRDKMRKDTRSYKIDALNDLDEPARKAFQGWLNTTRINLAETRRGAVDWGIMQRDNALLNYSNRTNLDAYAELAFPYQFWFTRSLGNWAKRMVSKPAMVGQMVRRQQMMQKNGRFWGSVPKRLQGKMVIPHAFSESWMGNFMYINPWQNLYPPFNLLSSVNTFNMQANSVNPVYTLTDMVNEGSITQEEMDEAMETQSGPNWEKAYARAIEENNADLQNPVTLASMMMSPSLWITELFGDKPAENLPSTKVGTALRSIGQRTPGILGPVAGMLGKALEAPEKFIRRNNFAYYGKWGEYKVNRMIANMVADGTLDYDRGMLAMINKSGPDYELAQKRLESELSMKVSGSALADTIIAKEWTQIPLATLVTLFPGGLYPIGEEEGVQLKQEMQIAWDELGKGNPYLINNFFNEHEGHLVRTGINDGPELQMKKFLAHNLRERYDALDPVNKGLIKVQLGEGFVKALLSGEIDYAKLTKQDLTVWLDAIGGKVPDTEIIPETQRIAADIFTDDEVKQITTYMDMREKLYPNHAWLQQNYGQLVNEIERKKYLAKFPELKLYWDWNRKYKHDHPIIGEWSGYYGNPDVGDSYQDPFYGLDKNIIQGYLNEKRQRFPDQPWQQEVYFSLPTDDERYAFIDANPSLAEAWEWDQQIEATNPTIAMYKKLKEAQYNMASNEPGTEKTPAQVSKNLALLNIHPFAIQDLVMSHSTGDPLSAGTRAELLRLFQSMGEPGGNFENWVASLF